MSKASQSKRSRQPRCCVCWGKCSPSQYTPSNTPIVARTYPPDDIHFAHSSMVRRVLLAGLGSIVRSLQFPYYLVVVHLLRGHVKSRISALMKNSRPCGCVKPSPYVSSTIPTRPIPPVRWRTRRTRRGAERRKDWCSYYFQSSRQPCKRTARGCYRPVPSHPGSLTALAEWAMRDTFPIIIERKPPTMPECLITP